MSLTPNMGLTTPNVGSTPGPTWATDLNTSLTLIDAHDHSPGYGVAITPAGMDINQNLPFNDYQATNVQAIAFSAQASLATTKAIYVIGADLYYNDGNSNVVRITQSGNVAGTPGSISGLVSPASASYAASKFVFQSNTNVAATIDVASIILRNTTASSFGLTLNPPSGMGANIAMTLPTLPAATKIMSMDNSGNMYAQTVVDNNTLEWTSNTTLKIKDSGVDTTQIANGAVTSEKLGPDVTVVLESQTFTASGNFSNPTGNKWIMVEIQAGGGGGGSGSSGNTGGADGSGGGGGAGQFIRAWIDVTGLSTVPVVVGAGGSGGASVSSGAGNNGNAGSNSSVAGNQTITAAGGGGGAGGATNGNGGAGGSSASSTRYYLITGAPGGDGQYGSDAGGSPAAVAGTNSYFYTGGTASNGGGGGGSGFFGNGGNGGATPGSGAGNAGSAAASNTGSGGGGGSTNGNASFTTGAGGNGGSGKVIIYYAGL